MWTTSWRFHSCSRCCYAESGVVSGSADQVVRPDSFGNKRWVGAADPDRTTVAPRMDGNTPLSVLRSNCCCDRLAEKRFS